MFVLQTGKLLEDYCYHKAFNFARISVYCREVKIERIMWMVWNIVKDQYLLDIQRAATYEHG